MNKITPFLWFNGEAEEATRFYLSVFPQSSLRKTVRNGKGGPAPEGSVLLTEFELNGTVFTALNGGPLFRFNEAVSFVISCDTQEEVDHYWNALSAGGEEQPCGWLKDKYGLSWQVVPTLLPALLAGDDPQAAARATQAMMGMKKLNIAALQTAYAGA